MYEVAPHVLGGYAADKVTFDLEVTGYMANPNAGEAPFVYAGPKSRNGKTGQQRCSKDAGLTSAEKSLLTQGTMIKVVGRYSYKPAFAYSLLPFTSTIWSSQALQMPRKGGCVKIGTQECAPAC